MKKILTLALLIASTVTVNAQVTDSTDTGAGKKKEIEKTGFSFGAIPIVAFDQDKGFQYGALGNIYDFGKGGWYPNPREQLYLEASLFVKNGNWANSQLFVINYDNRFLIPGVRFNFLAQFTNEKGLDFYGFNGYESAYDPTLPSGYYKLTRMVPYGKLVFSGKIVGKLYWKAGYHFKYFKIGSFELSDPSAVPAGRTLFDWYKEYNVIPDDDQDGGFTSSIRAGFMYDSRDIEANPSKGIWADANIEYAPTWIGTSNSYAKYYFCFRNYLPLYRDRLIFAYRLNVQGFLGQPAFYVLPYDSTLGQGYDRDGFGGYRNVRGIMRDRVVGKSVGYFNTELRWKFIDFQLIKQNFTLALSGFCDGARVLEKYKTWYNVDPNWLWGLSQYPNNSGTGCPDQLTAGTPEKFHIAVGGGFRIIMNKNFIIAVEYGRALNPQDNSKAVLNQDGTYTIKGKGSFYVNTGFLF